MLPVPFNPWKEALLSFRRAIKLIHLISEFNLEKVSVHKTVNFFMLFKIMSIYFFVCYEIELLAHLSPTQNTSHSVPSNFYFSILIIECRETLHCVASCEIRVQWCALHVCNEVGHSLLVKHRLCLVRGITSAFNAQAKYGIALCIIAYSFAIFQPFRFLLLFFCN